MPASLERSELFNNGLCLTASALGEKSLAIALLPCVNDISGDPVPTQTFQWVSTDFITYGFEFLGNQSGLPLQASTPTDYVPSLVPATAGIGAHLRLDFAPAASRHRRGTRRG
ncbi:hypothetical protein B0H17DRAFT_1194674 [Mycena rosella]|uniref:Uncharacterized protein n=1 Tax=Mycena rosella TaxID=1033263 RepID=A0AAD7GN49_MYCRO|nr:hypothetical protein B0H17DRAFT_1194674 [Mycena rosella]